MWVNDSIEFDTIARCNEQSGRRSCQEWPDAVDDRRVTELRTRPNYPEQLIITAAAGGHCQHCQHEVVCQVDSFAIVSSVFSLLLLLLLLLTPAAMHVQGSALAPAASPRPMSPISACVPALWQVHSHGCVHHCGPASWLHLEDISSHDLVAAERAAGAGALLCPTHPAAPAAKEPLCAVLCAACAGSIAHGHTCAMLPAPTSRVCLCASGVESCDPSGSYINLLKEMRSSEVN